MATAYPSPPMLRLARSAQSGVKALTAAWQAVYSGSSPLAYVFGSAIIDLSTMAAADTIEVRIRKMLTSGGAWVVHDLQTFNGARPADHVSVRIGAIPDVNGVEIAMRQTAGVLRNIPCEFYDAMRIGLE